MREILLVALFYILNRMTERITCSFTFSKAPAFKGSRELKVISEQSTSSLRDVCTGLSTKLPRAFPDGQSPTTVRLAHGLLQAHSQLQPWLTSVRMVVS